MSERKIVMEYTPPFVVSIEYFKKSGKYYSDGEYLSHQLHIFEIVEELTGMFKNKKRPGLVDGELEFVAYVRFPSHPHNHPVLIFPEDCK